MAHTPFKTIAIHPLAHWKMYAGAFVIMLSFPWFGWPMIPLGILILLVVEIARRAETLALYDDGLAREFTLLRKSKTFTEYESIQDFEVRQSFLERVFGIGSFHINTAGSHHQEIVFSGIKHPHELETIIRERMRPPVSAPIDARAAL